MTDTATRTARTFRGPGGAGLPNLAGLPGVLRLDAALPEVFETDRLDTDDRAAGRGGHHARTPPAPSAPAHWRLDLPDETLRMPAGESSDVPAELAELVRAAAREAALRPVGNIRTVRTENRLLGADDRLLATLVHDEVTVATMGRRADVRGWSEIDLRPDDGDDELLDGVAARVGETGMRPGAPAATAELDRMLRPAPRRRAGRKGSAGAVLMDYIARQVDRIAAEELRVRRDAPDAVHQMRVAARRLRSVLKAYREVLDRQRTDRVADAAARPRPPPRPGPGRRGAARTRRRRPRGASRLSCCWARCGPRRPGTSPASRRRRGPPC